VIEPRKGTSTSERMTEVRMPMPKPTPIKTAVVRATRWKLRLSSAQAARKADQAPSFSSTQARSASSESQPMKRAQ